MNNLVKIYTDGSSLGNPGPGGFGVVVVYNNKIIKEFGGWSKDTTNNKMELQGAIEALKYSLSLEKDKNIIIHTDSSYVILGITSWIDNWERNGWKTSNKKDVLNKDLWEELRFLKVKLGTRLSWQKVKGHADDIYNNRADMIATSCSSSKSNKF